MNHSKISVRYAKALFLAARDMKALDPVSGDMKLIAALFHDTPAFSRLLENPVIRKEQKEALFEKTFKKHVHKLTYDFILLLLKNGRETFLPGITRVFGAYYKREKGITEAILTSVEEIRTDLKEKLQNLLKEQLKTEIQFSEKVDPDLIGGFVLTVEDEQVDASVRRNLQNIKQELLK